MEGCEIDKVGQTRRLFSRPSCQQTILAPHAGTLHSRQPQNPRDPFRPVLVQEGKAVYRRPMRLIVEIVGISVVFGSFRQVQIDNVVAS